MLFLHLAADARVCVLPMHALVAGAAPAVSTRESRPGTALLASRDCESWCETALAAWPSKCSWGQCRACAACLSPPLSSALSERCARFQQSPYSPNAVAFTHLPKSGGTSYQSLLRQSSPGRKTCNVHLLPEAEFAASRQAGTLYGGTADCDILIGHANMAFEERGLEWRGRTNATFVTIVREPTARAASLFRYRGGRGQEYVAEVLSRNGSLQQEFEQFLAQQAPTMVAAWMHAPPEMFPAGADLSVWGHPSSAGSDAMSSQQLERVLAFIARRYGAVGVLERPDETAEVLRCRLPWISAPTLPRVDANAQTWTYPVKLTADAELMRNHTAVEQRLYDWANVLLTKDLECCRSSPPAAPTSSDHIPAHTALLVD